MKKGTLAFLVVVAICVKCCVSDHKERSRKDTAAQQAQYDRELKRVLARRVKEDNERYRKEQQNKFKSQEYQCQNCGRVREKAAIDFYEPCGFTGNRCVWRKVEL